MIFKIWRRNFDHEIHELGENFQKLINKISNLNFQAVFGKISSFSQFFYQNLKSRFFWFRSEDPYRAAQIYALNSKFDQVTRYCRFINCEHKPASMDLIKQALPLMKNLIRNFPPELSTVMIQETPNLPEKILLTRIQTQEKPKPTKPSPPKQVNRPGNY